MHWKKWKLIFPNHIKKLICGIRGHMGFNGSNEFYLSLLIEIFNISRILSENFNFVKIPQKLLHRYWCNFKQVFEIQFKKIWTRDFFFNCNSSFFLNASKFLLNSAFFWKYRCQISNFHSPPPRPISSLQPLLKQLFFFTSYDPAWSSAINKNAPFSCGNDVTMAKFLINSFWNFR